MPKETTSLQELADDALVVLATLGSLPAFDELIRRYRRVVVVTAEQVVGCRAVAEEVAQETFLKVFRALPQLEEPERFPGWLRAIARNQALQAAQKEWRHRALPVDELDAVIAESSHELRDPTDGWQERIEQEVVLKAMEALPPTYREVLYLAAYEDWPLARIADYLCVPETTVRGRLFRARQMIRRQFFVEENEENHE